MALAVFPCLPSPEGTFALECPLGQGAEPCIYVHTQCLSPAPPSASPHRSGEEKGHAKAGPPPPHSAPPPPCPGHLASVFSHPPNPGDQGAESRSWVCLILLIGFNFSFASSFSSSPCWGPGAEGKDRFMQLFSYVPCSEGVAFLRPNSSHPILHPLSGRVSLHVSFAVVGDV